MPDFPLLLSVVESIDHSYHRGRVEGLRNPLSSPLFLLRFQVGVDDDLFLFLENFPFLAVVY